MLECVIGIREKKMACFALEPMMRSIIQKISIHIVCVISKCVRKMNCLSKVFNKLKSVLSSILVWFICEIPCFYIAYGLNTHCTLHIAHRHTDTQRAKWTYWFCCKNNDWDHWFGLPKTIYFALCYVETVNFKYTLKWNEMKSTAFDFRTIEHLAYSQP